MIVLDTFKKYIIIKRISKYYISLLLYHLLLIQ